MRTAMCLALGAASMFAVPLAYAEEPTTTSPADSLRGRQSVSASGPLSVDESAAAARALERTLVRAGALLLAPGEIEIEPLLRYTRTERTAPASVGAPPMAGETRFKRNAVDAALGLRLGLPFDAQAEVSIPVSAVQDRAVTAVNGAPVAESDVESSGLGDVVVGVTKALLREDGLRPDLFVSATWDTATGDNNGGVAFGSGFNEFGVGLTAVKRIDPLVLVATGSYQHALENDGVQPGDQYSLDLRAVLAVSPTTSLRFGLAQTYVNPLQINGAEAPGTDQLVSTFVFGASGALSRRTLLDLELGIGLTEDAPQYRFQMALPFRIS